MERLTYEKHPNRWDCGKHPTKYTSRYTFQEVVDRLATYEDTMPLERAQELAQAEKDGRLVMPPCKVGDIVWTNMAIVGDRYRAADRPYPIEVVFIGMEADKCFFHGLYSNGRVFPFDFDRIGKTVFLAREEAEAVLKRREKTDNEAEQ